MTGKTITDIHGKKNKLGCLGCAIQRGEVETPGGAIAKSEYFEAQQDYEIPIPGFIIITSKRHLMSIDEFTDDEQIDFIKFICRVRKGMRKILDISTVYFIQEEDTDHHFHVWILPRYKWMTEEKFGRKITSVRPVMEFARTYMKTIKDLDEVVNATNNLRRFLEQEVD